MKSVPYKYSVSSLITASSVISAGFSKAFREVMRLLSLLILLLEMSSTSSPNLSWRFLMRSIYSLILSTLGAPEPVAMISNAWSTSISWSSVVALA